MRDFDTGWKTGPEYDLTRLKNDLFMAETYGKYEDGAFGHAISLPESGNEHYNNQPYTGIKVNSFLIIYIVLSNAAKKKIVSNAD